MRFKSKADVIAGLWPKWLDWLSEYVDPGKVASDELVEEGVRGSHFMVGQAGINVRLENGDEYVILFTVDIKVLKVGWSSTVSRKNK